MLPPHHVELPQARRLWYGKDEEGKYTQIKTPRWRWKGTRNLFWLITMATIIPNIREEEYQERIPEGSQFKCLRVAIYIIDLIIASDHLFPRLLTTITTYIIILTTLKTIIIFMLGKWVGWLWEKIKVFLLTSGNWNYMYPEQEKIVALTMVV